VDAVVEDMVGECGKRFSEENTCHLAWLADE